MGNVLSAGMGQAPARQAALGSYSSFYVIHKLKIAKVLKLFCIKKILKCFIPDNMLIFRHVNIISRAEYKNSYSVQLFSIILPTFL